MKQAAVVYWSGTGNTEAMAKKIAEGIESAGAKADVFSASDFSAVMMDSYDAIAFGFLRCNCIRLSFDGSGAIGGK